ncbi:MAG: asparagine synthase (glutamine-hydrolyzing) [Planctomycetaceae bacterium]|nr:asparagine synthase (glutamine-hydrolyzing) [Planctomycetaceae bacterium]MCB9952031.1 asparagine synthase (glutamine-hydrolyzing) [Planctomycetaceae bacterium]
MCGIAGILNFDRSPVDVVCLQHMTDAIQHRGPDGEGHHIDGAVGLGHRRLSIIDLEAGKQPLSNEDGTIWITFNGEIYNFQDLRARLEGLGHAFRTHSDTEAIIHAYEQWGSDCLHELRGMFAFAIWDGKKRQLLLARDRMGIKPLYYWRTSRHVAFGSELQALRTVPGFPGEFDMAAIDAFLHYQYIPAPHTAYQNVHKLEPAHFIVFEQDGQTRGPQRYWRLRFEADRSLDFAGWQERLRDALTEAVKSHLVSDVAFGAFLSGGIDSSLVVSVMSELLDEPVQAFCIGHPREEFDERQWARFAAEKCGANFIERVIDEDALDLLPKLAQHHGEPFADSSALPTYFVSQLAADNVKMVLSGDGGDELFAGYYAYPAILWEHRAPQSQYLRFKNRLANVARRFNVWPQTTTPADSKYVRTTPRDPAHRATFWRLEHQAVVDQTRREFGSRFDAVEHPHLLDTLQAFDLENYIPYDNLTKVDVASMFHGLEVRVPLLDHQFVETACQVPPEFRLTNMNSQGELTTPPGQTSGKHLLKSLAEKRFGAEFVNRPKRGFEIPVQHWFAGPRGGELKERILDSSLPLADWFEPAALQQVVNQASESKLSAWHGWTLLMLAEWCHQQHVKVA